MSDWYYTDIYGTEPAFGEVSELTMFSPEVVRFVIPFGHGQIAKPHCLQSLPSMRRCAVRISRCAPADRRVVSCRTSEADGQRLRLELSVSLERTSTFFKH
jgi:hypothetical protein